MKERIRILGLLVLGASVMTLTSWAQTKKANDKEAIRQQINSFIKAFRTRNVNLMMSLYTPDMVAFDIVPPLKDTGADTYRKTWEKTFKRFDGPIGIEVRDRNIVPGDKVAFAYQLLHLSASMTNGQKIDFWERMTLCFVKTNGKWLIMHEHVSVPADLRTGKAVLNLKP